MESDPVLDLYLLNSVFLSFLEQLTGNATENCTAYLETFLSALPQDAGGVAEGYVGALVLGGLGVGTVLGYWLGTRRGNMRRAGTQKSVRRGERGRKRG